MKNRNMSGILVSIFAVFLCASVLAGENGAKEKQYQEYLQLAEEGIPEAMFVLGVMNYQKDNHAEAVKWLGKASEQRHPKADFLLGVLYSKGDGMPKDEEKSASHMRRAALQGLPEAQNDCALMALNGRRTEEGRKWLELAARQFHGDAHITLAKLLAEPPDGGNGDILRAYMWLGWYTKSPRDRETYGMTVGLLKMLAKKMTEEQLKQADGMIRAMGGDDFTEKRNDRDPEIVKAVDLIAGQGYSEALAILEPLAEKGDAAAQYHLGGMYVLAEGVEKDAAKAKELFERAAAQGEKRAVFRLGRLYEDGGEHARAAEYYVQAARDGMPFAIQNLGNMLMRGAGVKLDLDKARRVYLLTAAEGDPMSQLALGLINSMEEPQGRNNVEAFKWLILAKPNLSPQIPRNLHIRCEEMIRELAREIGDDGMEEAQELVRRFMPVEIDPGKFDWDSVEISR